MGKFILGIITGIVLFLLIMYIIGKLDENNIRKQMGEDFEYAVMAKSELENYEKYKKGEQL